MSSRSASDNPRPDYSEGSENINTVSPSVSQYDFIAPTTTDEFSEVGDKSTRVGEYSQEPLAFGNDSNLYGEFDTLLVQPHNDNMQARNSEILH